MPNQKILIVDDEEEILEFTSAYLSKEGYRVFTCATASRALEVARRESPDLIILDIMLPDLDGLEVCRALRTELLIPILMISARGDEVDKIVGLGVGADDYITKPFSPGELVARVKAHLRRYMFFKGPESPTSGAIRVRGLEIDPVGYRVRKGDRTVELSVKEFELLRFLAEHPNQVFSRDRLYESVWGYDAAGDSRTVMVHILHLRRKLESDSYVPPLIETVWGAGYKFNLPDSG